MNYLAFLSLIALMVSSAFGISTCVAVNGYHILQFTNAVSTANATLPLGATQLLYGTSGSIQVMNTVCPSPSRVGVQEGCITGVAWGTFALIFDPVSGHLIYENNGIAISYQAQSPYSSLIVSPLTTGGYIFYASFPNGYETVSISGVFATTGSFVAVTANPLYYSYTYSACSYSATVKPSPLTPGSSIFELYTNGALSTQYTARAQLYPVNRVLPTFPLDFTPAALYYCKLAQYGDISNVLRYFCLVDYDVYGPTKTVLYSDVQNMLCSKYCTNGGTSVLGIENALYCDAAVCDWPLYRMNSVANSYFSPLIHYEDGKLVPVVEPMRAGSGWKQAFHAPMGGAYTFAVDTLGYCASGPANNVTVNVNCYSSLRAYAGSNMTLQLDEYGMYTVKLQGSISGDLFSDNIHVSWKFLSVPTKVSTSTVTISPPNVLTPTFIANAAGTYVAEMTAFDGCSLSRAVVGITVNCVNVSLLLSTQSYYSDVPSFVFRHSVKQHNQETFSLSPVCSSYNPVASWILTLYATYSSFITTLARVDTLATPLVMTKTTVANVDYYTIGLSLRNQVNLTSSAPLVTPQTCISYPPALITPPTDHNEILSNYYIDECVSDNKVTQTTTVTYDSLTRNECTITVTNYLSYFSISVQPVPEYANPITVADLSDTMNTSALTQLVNRFYPFQWGSCVGKYQLTFNNITHPLMCGVKTVVSNFEVQCDHPSHVPQANTLCPCWDVRYSYTLGQFPITYLRGNDAIRNPVSYIIYQWYLYTKPSNSSLNFPAVSSPTTSFVPDVPGYYQFKYAVGDYCRVETEVRDLRAVCTEILTVQRWTTPAAVVAFDYNTLANNVVHLYLNVTSSATPKFGTVVQYNVVTYPSSAGLSFSGTFADMSIRFARAGTWVFKVSATDGCSTIIRNFTFTSTCSNPLSAQFSVVGSPVYNQSNVHIFPAFVASYSSTNSYVSSTTFYQDGIPTYLPGTSTTYYVTSPGTHLFRQVIVDYCGLIASYNVSTNSSCATNIITPYIQINVTSELYFEDWAGKTINLVGEKSTVGGITPFTWSPMSFKWFITMLDGTVVVANTMDTQFTLSSTKCGQYYVILQVGDGCKYANASLLIHLKCRNQVSAAASISSNSVTFTGVKFPKVQLAGNGSSTGTLLPSQVAWTWTVLEAPAGSAFWGRDMHNVTSWVKINNVVTQGTPYVMAGHTLRYQQTNITTNEVLIRRATRYSVLRNDQYRTASFGSCFRPDLPGYYAFELKLQGPCPADNSTSKVYVNALCQTAPTVSAEIYSLNSVGSKIANTYLYQKVFFDASATTIAAGTTSQLSYTWTLKYCPADTQPTDYTGMILNQKSAKAQWWPNRLGNYCLNLNVTDGCQTITRDWTFSVTCADIPAAAPTPVASYTLDGFGNQIVMMRMDDTVHVTSNNPFLYSYEWKLVKFKPNGIF